MKKVCLYIVGIALVVLMTLVLSGELQVSSLVYKMGIVQTEEQAIQTVYKAVLDGETEVTIRYMGEKTEIKAVAQKIVEETFLIDDENTSDDYDYLKNKYRGYTASINGMGIYNIKYQLDLSETAEQTSWVNTRVSEILNELELDDATEYQKVKKIHDYIINHIAYDLSVTNNSAYEGLKNKATACQGYANLAYKMLTDAGIACRVITGEAGGEAHAWNIVRINDLWYNLDCTWDDPIGGASDSIGKKYAYFLKSENHFRDHIRDDEYNTIEFNEEYRMSEKDWTKK